MLSADLITQNGKEPWLNGPDVDDEIIEELCKVLITRSGANLPGPMPIKLKTETHQFHSGLLARICGFRNCRCGPSDRNCVIQSLRVRFCLFGF